MSHTSAPPTPATQDPALTPARQAALEFLHRNAFLKPSRSPRGTFAGDHRLWTPHVSERRACCDTVHAGPRTPHLILWRHCKSREHLASLFSVPEEALLTAIEEVRLTQNIASRMRGASPQDDLPTGWGQVSAWTDTAVAWDPITGQHKALLKDWLCPGCGRPLDGPGATEPCCHFGIDA